MRTFHDHAVVPMQLTLYSKEQCHLCDEALALISELGLSAQIVDVETDDALMAEYGLRIPVVVNSAGRELGWPFDLEQLRELA